MQSTEQTFEEQCWFLKGIKIWFLTIGFVKYHSKGDSCSVEFNWKQALSKTLLGWMHTHHDQISLTPSGEDTKTMRSWVRSLNKPLICIIKNKTMVKSYLFKYDHYSISVEKTNGRVKPFKNITYKQVKMYFFKNFIIGWY